MNDPRQTIGTAMRRLRTVEPGDDDDTDLAPLGDAIGDARVVALGESMHRVHEFLALRDRVFRYLSREHGFTAIAIESGFAEGLAVQRWIDGEPSEPLREVLRHGMTYHFGACEESVLLDETRSTMNGDGEILSTPRTAFDGAIHIDRITPWHTWLTDEG